MAQSLKFDQPQTGESGQECFSRRETPLHARRIRTCLHNMLHNRDTGAFRRIAGAPFLHVG